MAVSVNYFPTTQFVPATMHEPLEFFEDLLKIRQVVLAFVWQGGYVALNRCVGIVPSRLGELPTGLQVGFVREETTKACP